MDKEIKYFWVRNVLHLTMYLAELTERDAIGRTSETCQLDLPSCKIANVTRIHYFLADFLLLESICRHSLYLYGHTWWVWKEFAGLPASHLIWST